MKNLNRRATCISLYAFLTLGISAAGAQQASVASQQGNHVLSSAEVFPFEQMSVKRMANGGETRNVVSGVLKTGEGVAVHESTLPPGSSPNPGHSIQHSEFIVVREGTLKFEHDGKDEQVGPGGVIYVAFGTMHKIVNIGTEPAKYVVIAIGGNINK